MKQHPAPKSSAWSAGYAEPTAPAEPRTAGSGPSEVSGIPPSPSEGRQLPCASCNRATKLLDGVAVHTQDNTPVIDCGDKHPDDAVAEWIGGAVPVISKVLASHVPHERGKYHYVECVDPHGTHDFHLDDWVAWHAHVSPIIAEDLAQPPDALTRLGADYRCGLRYTVGVLQREAERLKALQLKYTDPTLYTHAISVVEKLLDAIDLELNLTTK